MCYNSNRTVIESHTYQNRYFHSKEKSLFLDYHKICHGYFVMKTKFMEFSTQHKAELIIKINQEEIEQAQCIQFLGLYVDESLT